VILIAALTVSCHRTQTVGGIDVIAKVKDRTLTREEVVKVIPKGVSSADSLLIAANHIKKWATDELVYSVALRNLEDEKAEIEKLVEIYRYSLYHYRYLERLTKERLSVEIGDADKLKFYDENKEKFKLERAIIKGLFMKLPLNAPKLEDVKTWNKSTSAEALGNIEQYSVQNAISYDYFYDRWVDFDDILSNIPVHIADASHFLRTDKSLEKNDSSYCYLLNIKEYILSGNIAPYDYVEPKIVEILINQRKQAFLKKFEDELFKDAIKKGDVVFEDEFQSNVNKKTDL
jgi:hypothetical protein